MDALALVVIAGLALLAAYFTYGRWLSRRVFQLDPDAQTPAITEQDGRDFVPTPKSIIFGHHFTSIAGTGPIVGPAIAVMWGWLPAILWVVIGAIFIGAVHDLGSIVVSLRKKGRSIGDIAGDLLGPRVRVIFLFILVVALWIVLAVFGLVIAVVLRQYPASIFPVLVQIPLALVIGVAIHRKGRSIVLPSVIALALMYASVVFGNVGWLGAFNAALAAQPIWLWTSFLLGYAYVASVLPVWVLLQPRDYVNALQLLTALGLITVGLVVAAVFGGPSDSAGASVGVVSIQYGGPSPAPPNTLSIVAPMINWQPIGAPPMLPVLFITIACGACSGFHCLVGSGTTSKQLTKETHAKAVGYGAMLTEGFLATLVIAACAAGIGFLPMRAGVDEGWINEHTGTNFNDRSIGVSGWWSKLPKAGPGSLVHQSIGDPGVEIGPWVQTSDGAFRVLDEFVGAGDYIVGVEMTGRLAFNKQYESWSAAGSLGSKVGAFIEGAANFVASLGIPRDIAIALMAVMVASFAATTMDTSCRLQRYVIQELSGTFLPKLTTCACPSCGYDLSGHVDSDEDPHPSPLPGGEGAGTSPPISSAPTSPLGRGRDDGVVAGEGSSSFPSSTSSSSSPIPSPAVVNITCPECGTTHSPSIFPHTGRGASIKCASALNPFKWLATAHGATLFAVSTAALLAAIPPQGQPWSLASAGQGALILWPLFGATNQLLAGFAFVVIVAWLAATKRPLWFAVPPAIIMLIVPAAAMTWQAFIGNETNPSWFSQGNWLLLSIATVTLVLEAWLIIETALRWIVRKPVWVTE